MDGAGLGAPASAGSRLLRNGRLTPSPVHPPPPNHALCRPPMCPQPARPARYRSTMRTRCRDGRELKDEPLVTNLIRERRHDGN